MSAFAAITLANSVPANVVFSPARIDSKGIAKWMAPSTVVYDDKPSMTLLVREPQNGSNVARVTGKITVPVMDTVDTSLKLGDAIGSFEYVLPKQCTLVQRQNIHALLKDLLTEAVITDAVENLASVY